MQGNGQRRRDGYPARPASQNRRVAPASPRTGAPAPRPAARPVGPNWFQRQLKLRPKPLWMVIVAHVLVLGLSLLIYAVPHHVLSYEEQAVGVTSTRGGMTAQNTVEPAAEPSVGPSAEPAAVPDVAVEPTLAPSATLSLADAALGATPVPTQSTATAAPAAPAAEAAAVPTGTDGVGQFRVKYADKFTSGEVEYTDTAYKSANINVSFSTVRYEKANVHVADIYVADISNFITVFGKDTYGRGTKYTENVVDYAARMKGIVTLSGDYYGARDGGVVIRNGTLYRDEKNTRDVCVLYWDGSVKCFAPGDFDAETEMARGAYQCWNFGPKLLDDFGQPMEDFNTSVGGRNPRAIFGYYEPGHYCFIMVDGRSDESKGLSMKECSQMVYAAGLAQAFNLDGGQTAVMAKAANVYGDPYKGGRKVSDVLMIVDGAQQ